jgi:hypothetical protein
MLGRQLRRQWRSTKPRLNLRSREEPPIERGVDNGKLDCRFNVMIFPAR